MRILIAVAAIAATSFVTTAYAGEGRLSDGQFIKAAHCRGLASGDVASSLDGLLKAQKRGRSNHVVDAADEARASGARLARTDAAAAQASFSADCAKFGA